MAMYSVPQPFPLPIPLPVPVPVILPLGKDVAEKVNQDIQVGGFIWLNFSPQFL